MAAIAHYKTLTKAAENSLAIKGYVEGPGLRGTLTDIGDSELRTATKILERLADAEDKPAALGKVLAQLQAAHKKYQAIHQDTSQGWRKDLCMEAVTKDILVCSAIALCHCYLNDSYAAIEAILTEAEKAFKSSIYLTDHNDRGERSATAQMDATLGSFLGRINREDLNDRDTFDRWNERGKQMTDTVLDAGTFVYNAINPFYYKYIGNLQQGKSERIQYGDFVEIKAHLQAVAGNRG